MKIVIVDTWATLTSVARSVADGRRRACSSTRAKVRCPRPVSSCARRLNRHLPVIVVVNKVDGSDARISEVVDEVYAFFFDLDAADHHIEFPILYCNACSRCVARPRIRGQRSEAALRSVALSVPAPEYEPRPPAPGPRHQPRRAAVFGGLRSLCRAQQGTDRQGSERQRGAKSTARSSG